MELAEGEKAIGARGSGGDGLAIRLRARNGRKARQQYCDDTCGPMFHASQCCARLIAR
jgi:hypothetical protein